MENIFLAGLQGINKEIYEVQNDRNFETSRMVSRLHRYVTLLLKAVRKDKLQSAGYHLAMSLSWSLALANRFHINLEWELWNRFPAVCPYCGTQPCLCRERPDDRKAIERNSEFMPGNLPGFQKMLADIYPNNTLKDSVIHLAEEAGELDEAVEHFLGTHEPRLFEEIVVELVDTVANLLAVATCLNLSLASEMAKLFVNGCPKCRQIPCGCGFTTAKSPASLPVY